MSFLDDLSNFFKKGVTVVAQKTDEYAKIGKIKVDIIGIKRDIDKNFTELGGRVYQLIVDENDTNIASNNDVKMIISTVNELHTKLQIKKVELEKVREEYAKKGNNPNDIEDVAVEEVPPRDEAKG
ncbi:MAG: hypothetical protein ACOY90_22215 [Candidatus Zhuqueibacterota bacterium]